MAKFKESKYFIRKNVTPGSMLPGNVVAFSYKSPKGVHDKSPLVYVLEARVDRFFGLNMHYEMEQLDTLLELQIETIQGLLEIEWFKKYPAKKKEFQKNDVDFEVSMIEKKDLPTLARKVQKKYLEQFELPGKESQPNLRCYLYSRMNRVSKLVWKII